MPRRAHNALRPIQIVPHFLSHPEGSVLIMWGDTHVICTATVEEKVPSWLEGKDKGWVTAEYDMLPRSTHTRKPRDSHKGKIPGRTQEIGRLIGRALRGVVHTGYLGERIITIDCDVIQADGGTRTAAITGGYVALAFALAHLRREGRIKQSPLLGHVAAVSLGIVDGEMFLDLDYHLDSRADVDMNIIMTDDEKIVEIQGTAEQKAFSKEQLHDMLTLAYSALPKLVDLQKRALEIHRGNKVTVTI